MTRHPRLLALVAAAALFVTACGGDDDDDDSAAIAEAAEAAEEGEDDEEIAEDAAEAADALGLDEDCAEAMGAMAAVGASASSAMSGDGGDLDESLAAFRELADAAPEEISDDMKLMADAYGQFVEAILDSGWDAESGEMPPEEVMEALEDLDQDGLTAASERVSAYFEDHCGASLGE
jgi:hypothetical protein